MMNINLAGKHALVTGGTRGIGRAIVLALAEAGAEVVTCYRTDGEQVQSLIRELKEFPGQHHVIQADVSTPADVDRLVGECRDRFGTVDILVNNAGVISQVPFADLSIEEWGRVLDNNLTGTFMVIQRALPLMSAGGSVINIGSRVAMVGLPLRAHYTASKAGVIGLTRTLCKELGKQGIRVNVVAPGMVATEEDDALADAEKEQYRQRYQHLMALGRFGRPADIAGAVLFLASDLAGYVTGETIHVDGGV